MDDQRLWYGIVEAMKACISPMTDDHIDLLLDKLKQYYEDGYTNNYSRSYQLATALCEKVQDREMLYENLKNLSLRLGKKQDFPLKRELGKFFDYLVLEISRNNALKETLENSQYVINNLSSEASRIDDELRNVTDNMRRTQEQLDKTTGNSVANLGVIAGMAFVFTGGLSMLGSAFTAIQGEISKYRMVFMLLVVGLIVFNIILMLFFVVSRINKKDIGISCKFAYGCNYCTRSSRKSSVTNILCQLVNKYPYALFFNALLIYLTYAVFVLWMYSPNNKDIFVGFVQHKVFGHWASEWVLLLTPIGVALLAARKVTKKKWVPTPDDYISDY